MSNEYKDAPKTFALRFNMEAERHEVWKLFASDGSEHWIRQVAVPDTGRSPGMISLIGHLVQIGGLIRQRGDGNLYLPDVELVQEIVRKLGYAVERQNERLDDCRRAA